MVDEYQSLLVVIPTRNRAQLAIGAIQSVFSQEVDNVRVLVSDNSTIAEEVASLSRYCEQLQDKRLRYLATPADLPMSPHWDWAMTQALESDATHFTVLTDRMVFRPGILVHRALDRSNGETLASGFRGRDHADFLTSIRFDQMNFVTPVPQVRTRFNFIVNEYCLIRTESGSRKFPELNRDNYLKFLATELSECEDQNFKNEMMKMLAANGFREQPNAGAHKSNSSSQRLGWAAKLRNERTKRFGPERAKYFAITPAEIDGLEFADTNEALTYAFKFPRPSDALLLDQQTMLQARPVGSADEARA